MSLRQPAAISAEELERRLADAGADDREPVAASTGGPDDGPRGVTPPETAAELAPRRIALLAGAALLSSLAGAWMVGSLFRGGVTPRLTLAAGAALGTVVAGVAARARNGAFLQAAIIPIAAIAGAVVVAPSATGGTANLPGLVGDALRGGGLLQPPIPFDPGWRFIGIVLFAMVAATAVGAATAFRRPRLAVAVPLPVTLAAALLQPEGKELGPSAVAGVLAIAALALADGADRPDTGAATARFEARRLGRGAALLAVLVVAVVGISRADFLFPEPDREEVIPPQRPPVPPPEPDRVLFSVDGAERGPWRVGVLDTYDGEAFLLPPIDPARVIPVADIPAAAPGTETRRVTFTIADVRTPTLPAPAGITAVAAARGVEYDPRTGVLRLPSGRPPKDFRYTVTATAPPSGKVLGAAPAPPARLAEFVDVPPAPNEVVSLLAAAPANPFDRLQFVRQRLYNNVVAAGAGRPGEVPPARVAAMLRPGAEATPYEITAAEVLLARWAGVPARIGFGFYGGEAAGDGLAFRPRHGAAWLEAYFEGPGWVPLVGTPPRAKASLDDEQKNEDPNVLATQDLALIVFVPVRLSDIELLYEKLRYWASWIVPVLALLGLALAAWPAAAKAVRRWQRQRWAAERGPTARIWVAYSELRDRAHDLNVGGVGAAPLEFLDAVQPDAEHEELAWLVTRAVWGDLRRDVTDDDADVAVDLAQSVTRRLAGAQTALNRLAASLSRASLRTPYSPELPDVGLASGATGPVAAPAATRRRRPSLVTRLRGAVLRPRTAVVAVALAVVVVVPLVLPGESTAAAELPSRLPASLTPADVLGYRFVREPGVERSFRRAGEAGAITTGRVFTIQKETLVAGSFQTVVFEPDVDIRDRGLQLQVENTVLSGTFTTEPFGPVRLRVLRTAEQQAFVWFPPTHNVMQLWVFRGDVADARQVVERVISHQLGLTQNGGARP